MSPYFAEFLATAVLILLGNGTVANVLLKDTKGNNSGLIVITTGWAMAVFAAVCISSPYSGAHLNPAVTVLLAVAGKFPCSDVLPYIASQLAGGFVGAVLVWMFYRQHIERTDDKGLLQAMFCTAPAIKNVPSNFFSEFIGTSVLLLGVLFITGGELVCGEMIKLSPEGSVPLGLGSVGAMPIAFFVWVIGIALGGTTGYAINPARDLAPRIAHALLPMKYKGDSGWSYSWIPVVAPLSSALVLGLLFSYFMN